MPPRVARAIDLAYRTLFGSLLLVGLPFVWAGSSLGAWHVLVSYGLIALLVLSFSVSPSCVAWIRRFRPGTVLFVSGTIAFAAGMNYAYRMPGAYERVLFLLVVPSAFALLWARRSGRVEPLLSALPILLGGLLLFALELPDRRPDELAQWGDERTFASLFPTEPPYIGPGGRLRPGVDDWMESKEHHRGVRIVTNSQGFRNEREIAYEREPGELRVLDLGDSYSIGMQAGQTAFFGARLRARLEDRFRPRPVTVINAEISDPAYGLLYLQQFGLRYRPDIVVLGICGNDMMQAEQFTGPQARFRLTPEGRIVPNPDDRHEPGAVERLRDLAYPAVIRSVPTRSGWLDRVRHTLSKIGASFLRFRMFAPIDRMMARHARPAVMYSFAEEYEARDGRKRLIDGMANLGYFLVEPVAPIESMYERFFEILQATDHTVRQAGARLLVVLHPQRFQVDPQDWAILRDSWSLDEADFDLELYNRRVGAFCDRTGIACLDLLPVFRSSSGGGPLYLPGGDNHYNERGHDLAAQAVADRIASMDRAGRRSAPAH